MLGEVAQFVGEYRGEGVAVRREGEQPRIDADHAAGHREGVQLAAGDQRDDEIALIQLAPRRQLTHDATDPVQSDGIIPFTHMGAELTQPGATDTIFIVAGDAATRTPQVRQSIVVVGCGRRTGDRRAHQQQAEQGARQGGKPAASDADASAQGGQQRHAGNPLRYGARCGRLAGLPGAALALTALRESGQDAAAQGGKLLCQARCP